MSILTKLGAFAKKAVTVEIGGQTWNFYPPRMRTVLNGGMGKLIQPLAAAVQTLFASTEEDNARQFERDENGTVRSTYVQGVPAETIKLRAEQKQAALQRVIDMIFNDETRYQFAMLLADSLRDDFDTDERKRATEARKFIDELELPQLYEFLRAYLRAVSPLLDAQGNSMLSGLHERIKAEVERQLGQVEEQPASASPLRVVRNETPTPTESSLSKEKGTPEA